MAKETSSKTLVDRLMEIEKIPDTVEVDKIKEYRKVFEEFRAKNSLVDRVIRGNISFSAETEKSIGIFGGKSVYLPHFVDSKQIKDFEELMEIIGYPHISPSMNFTNVVGNPIGFGVAIGSIAYVSGVLKRRHEENNSTNRRDFLKLLLPVGGGAAGALGGLLGSDIRNFQISSARKYATYADTKVKILYRK